MVVYKDEKTWTVQCRIKNRDGTTKQHKKRGFLTKKEAKEYESKITSKVPKCHMKSSEFYEIYLLDKKNELKYRTILTKRQMIETHILPDCYGGCILYYAKNKERLCKEFSMSSLPYLYEDEL